MTHHDTVSISYGHETHGLRLVIQSENQRPHPILDQDFGAARVRGLSVAVEGSV